jgi:hypothetical protein
MHSQWLFNAPACSESRKKNPEKQGKTFDLQMIMIIIACIWSRDQSIAQETLGRTPGISPHQANHGF